MDIETIKSLDSTSPLPASLDDMTVEFGVHTLVPMAGHYANVVEAKVSQRARVEISQPELEQYFTYLLSMRIAQVRGDRTPRAVRMLFVPSLYALALVSVGVVFDKEQGLRIIPTMDSNVEICSLEEAQKVSEKLALIEDFGVELVVGLPRDIKGDVDFMLFSMTENEITRYSKHAPSGMATLASFFHMKQVESLLCNRVSYGYIEEHQETLRGLIYDSVRT